MVYFVIAGKPDCSHFVHVSYVASYLEKHLPNFKAKKIQLREGEWENWLVAKNRELKWNHTTSPIIWKELLYQGGKPYLIGGISQFWEYCYDYYGLESILPKNELDMLTNDNLEYFNRKENELLENEKYVRNICIYGALNPMLEILIPELLKIDNLWLKNGLAIYLYDEQCEDLSALSVYIEEILNFDNAEIIVAHRISDALTNCDLLLIIENMSSKNDIEEDDSHIIRSICKMNFLATEINSTAKRSLRIVFANPGPSSLCACIFVEMCTLIRPVNIVAVSSDLGLGPLSFAAKDINIPLGNLCGPPVWGFIGSYDIVDIGSSIKKCDIYKPYKRAIKGLDGSTLVHGTIYTELRFINYLTDENKNFWEKIKQNREGIVHTLGRPSTYAKISALINLLRLWYSPEPDVGNKIISLGILGNGTFGIPSGMVFSQPAVLINNIWTPFKNYPVPALIKIEIETAVRNSQILLEKYNIGPNTYNNNEVNYI